MMPIVLLSVAAVGTATFLLLPSVLREALRAAVPVAIRSAGHSPVRRS